MKLIGKGWQYRVYDTGNGRVRKIERSPIDSFWRICFQRPSKLRFMPLKSYREMQRIYRDSAQSVNALKEILPSMPPHLMGNVIFREGIDYDQDYAMPIAEYFERHTIEENKEVVTAFANLVLEFWKFGFGDTVFNFTINNAVDTSGRVIQIDIGEFIFDKEVVREETSRKKWLGQWAYTSMPDGELKDHFKNEMGRILTLEALEKNWRKNVTS